MNNTVLKKFLEWWEWWLSVKPEKPWWMFWHPLSGAPGGLLAGCVISLLWFIYYLVWGR